MPKKKELSEIYNETYYDSWGEKEDSDSYWKMKKSLYSSLLQNVSLQGSSVLDVGCATGACLSVIEDAGGAAYGIDVNPYAVKQAKKRVMGAVVCEGFLDQPFFADEMFDVIIMSDVLEHMSEPKNNIAIVYRLLKPGGLFIVLTPDFGSVSACLMGKRWVHIKNEHLFYFSRNSMDYMLKEVGFAIRCIKCFAKPISFGYAANQLEHYHLPFVSRFFSSIRLLLPNSLLRYIWRVPMGEFIAISQK